ncbi:hypothetical protein FNV43_RR19188 [Rhamnella rubrinervis]|uniref:Seven transmembrane MLO family protein n=1 Tax=Rhamnella rubrinervis TaxID=2594499 RepID=A0A8K0EBZ5_9ROSA|nr:hypothetical protein FNV43_RR19188 [Rhamnella rubrinervis]
MEEHLTRERSLFETPTWAVATVISVMVSLGFFVNACLEEFGKWLNKTHRKALLAALEKIREELMLFGLLSLLMGHWTIIVAKICINPPAVLDSRFYPCAVKSNQLRSVGHSFVSRSDCFNRSVSIVLVEAKKARFHNYCPQGLESFASYESLEQLHRFIFVLGVTHVLYSFVAIALAMIKIYSWRIWENEAKAIATQSTQDAPQAMPIDMKIRRLSTFISHRTSHPWSHRRVLVWLLCFSRQFWSSINRSDYKALRLGFITVGSLLSTWKLS